MCKRAFIFISLNLVALLKPFICTQHTNLTSQRHSYVVDENCPRFVLAETCTEGFGDQLEHFIYAMYIAKLLNGTVVTDGFARGPLRHSGTTEYAKVAEELLGIDLHIMRELMTRYKPRKHTVSYDQALEMFNKSTSTPCNTLIISDITSCGMLWCHAVRQFDSLRETVWILRNNSAQRICAEWRKNQLYMRDAEHIGRNFDDPTAVRIVWHVRTGDLCLHCNDTSYFSRVDHLIRRAVNGYKFTVTFESQQRVPWLESQFPHYTMRVNSSLFDTVCDFISSDILITSGSSLAPLIAAAGGTPWHPIVFEEMIKDQGLPGTVTHHFFAHDDAILLNNSVPYLPINNIVTAVQSILHEKFGPTTGKASMLVRRKKKSSE